MGNLKNNQRKLKQEDKNDNFKDVWDGSEIFFKNISLFRPSWPL